MLQPQTASVRSANRRRSPARAFDWSDLMPSGKEVAHRSAFAVYAAAVDVFMIFLAALVSGLAYHHLAFGEDGPRELFVTTGLFVALIFVGGNVLRGEYAMVNYLRFGGHPSRAFLLWNVAVACATVGGFLSKTGADFSRVTAVLFFVLGFGLLVGGRFAAVSQLRADIRRGRAPVRRVFLLGNEADILAATSRAEPTEGVRVVSAAVLRGPRHLPDDLALAAASARMLRPDDVVILAPWSDATTIDACVDAFLRVPAALHLALERVPRRFTRSGLSTFGTIESLNLAGHSLTPLEAAAKRAFDILVGSAVVLLAAPIMLAVAVAIKCDSPGPVLFRQRRYGFNQEPFRIAKFRSMTAGEDGRDVVQATADDARVTRVGRLIRRWNLDELPQLFNVIGGRMSLVGPRPHALLHDQQFESGIALYARRHNVKPGITGWAQVKGFRGETATDEAIRGRIEHDLWYIDHWSLALDLKILALTVFSPRAYRNAA